MVWICIKVTHGYAGLTREAASRYPIRFENEAKAASFKPCLPIDIDLEGCDLESLRRREASGMTLILDIDEVGDCSGSRDFVSVVPRRFLIYIFPEEEWRILGGLSRDFFGTG